MSYVSEVAAKELRSPVWVERENASEGRAADRGLFVKCLRVSIAHLRGKGLKATPRKGSAGRLVPPSPAWQAKRFITANDTLRGGA